MMQLVFQCVHAGIPVTLNKGENGKLYADLNTESKSHGHLHTTPDGIFYHGRYDRKVLVNDFEDICNEVAKGLHGRDYVSDSWRSILSEKGLI